MVGITLEYTLPNSFSTNPFIQYGVFGFKLDIVISKLSLPVLGLAGIDSSQFTPSVLYKIPLFKILPPPVLTDVLFTIIDVPDNSFISILIDAELTGDE